jgi:hypothetical protein
MYSAGIDAIMINMIITVIVTMMITIAAIKIPQNAFSKPWRFLSASPLQLSPLHAIIKIWRTLVCHGDASYHQIFYRFAPYDHEYCLP